LDLLAYSPADKWGMEEDRYSFFLDGVLAYRKWDFPPDLTPSKTRSLLPRVAIAILLAGCAVKYYRKLLHTGPMELELGFYLSRPLINPHCEPWRIHLVMRILERFPSTLMGFLLTEIGPLT